ncbi:MAG: hypothetical protein V3S51_02280 [Dehalococcoidia bacterium]
MNETRYEVVEKDEDTRDSLLSALIEHPTQGIAYMCLRSSGPMSATEIIDYLALSDTWFTEKFNEAVGVLSEKGLIREATA